MKCPHCKKEIELFKTLEMVNAVQKDIKKRQRELAKIIKDIGNENKTQ